MKNMIYQKILYYNGEYKIRYNIHDLHNPNHKYIKPTEVIPTHVMYYTDMNTMIETLEQNNIEFDSEIKSNIRNHIFEYFYDSTFGWKYVEMLDSKLFGGNDNDDFRSERMMKLDLMKDLGELFGYIKYIPHELDTQITQQELTENNSEGEISSVTISETKIDVKQKDWWE